MIEVPGEDLRVGHRPVRAARVLHVVHRNRRLVQVALEDEARRIDEVLVAGIALHRVLLEVHGGTQRLEVDVDDAVGLGQ